MRAQEEKPMGFLLGHTLFEYSQTVGLGNLPGNEELGSGLSPKVWYGIQEWEVDSAAFKGRDGTVLAGFQLHGVGAKRADLNGSREMKPCRREPGVKQKLPVGTRPPNFDVHAPNSLGNIDVCGALTVTGQGSEKGEASREVRGIGGLPCCWIVCQRAEVGQLATVSQTDPIRAGCRCGEPYLCQLGRLAIFASCQPRR